MKWKVMFSSYKPVRYDSSVEGNGYYFGFINSEAKVNSHDINPKLTQTFSKRKIYQSEIDKELKRFLDKVSDDFWLELGSYRSKVINWNDGGTLRIIYTDKEEDYEGYWPTYTIEPYKMSFTELVAIYYELSNLEGNLKSAIDPTVFMSLGVAMYQYLWSTNHYLRYKVLKVLKDEPLNFNYRGMEGSFIHIESQNWKYPGMK